MVQPWLRFHISLIEPDMQVSRIRLSDKTVTPSSVASSFVRARALFDQGPPKFEHTVILRAGAERRVDLGLLGKMAFYFY